MAFLTRFQVHEQVLQMKQFFGLRTDAENHSTSGTAELGRTAHPIMTIQEIAPPISKFLLMHCPTPHEPVDVTSL